MPRQKRHALPFQRPEHNRIRRIAERRLHTNLPRLRQTAHRIQSASTNDADGCLAFLLGTLCLLLFLRRHARFLRGYCRLLRQLANPLLVRISLTAVNGSFFRSATSAASSVSRFSPPAPPSARSSNLDSSSSINRFFQCSTCFRCRSPLAAKCF